MSIASTDGVEVAVYDLVAKDADGSELLISHATGFHGHCYGPFAEALAPRFHSIAFDYRGHGDTPQPAHIGIDWNRYADDAEAVALSLSRPLAAFGHSMGGSCLLIAAHRHPRMFSHLVIYEPIVFAPLETSADDNPPQLAAGARRRRTTFASFDAALENFSAKPPLANFVPDALEAYVRHGFREGIDGQVHLKCEPELEATTFEMSREQHTWDMLPHIETPVLVLCGLPAPGTPAEFAEKVADRLPNGTYRQVDELDHFGPMTHPVMVAGLVAGAI